MNTYLSEKSITELVNLCEKWISKEDKKTLDLMFKKTGIKFNQAKEINLNLLWQYALDEMLTKYPKFIMTTGETYKEALSRGNFLSLINHQRDYIKENWLTELQFLSNQNTQFLIDEIRHILLDAFNSNVPTISELLEINDYQKYFSEHYGIESIDKKSIQNTERIAKFLNELTAGIPNKNNLFQAMDMYMKNGALSELHNSIHQI